MSERDSACLSFMRQFIDFYSKTDEFSLFTGMLSMNATFKKKSVNHL